ncbi:unnamed protein product [Triticum turgidum subsp. durum]|uniref:Uncharacterized protein n=1 Tax=Triticum turgidum subsp. durum TaxID=4567 RepID=A0A9R1Q8A9_TRITD|nr:unnamed protein product [Triticum turgidum subsp. durum]
MSPSLDLPSRILPRVLIVSRRTVRKNKFVDFVGEYHLDLVVGYGAVPVIVPRVAGVHAMLDSFEPIHGVLLCEGEDIDPSLYDAGGDGIDGDALSPEQLEAGVRRLAERFVPMAHAPDGLVEGFYDPDAYNPGEGKFLMGLQFHPERMRKEGSDEFDYPGCAKAYQEFVRAVVAYKAKLAAAHAHVHVQSAVTTPAKLNHEMEKQRKVIGRSVSLAKNMYMFGNNNSAQHPAQHRDGDLDGGAEFLESNTALSVQQEKRLKQMGATVRNASGYMNRLKVSEEREAAARAHMAKMSVAQLASIAAFYRAMGNVCSEVLDAKLQPPSPTLHE